MVVDSVTSDLRAGLVVGVNTRSVPVGPCCNVHRTEAPTCLDLRQKYYVVIRSLDTSALMNEIRVLDVCTGIAGMGLRIPHKTVMYVERDAFCRSILQKRMDDGDLQQAPLCSELRDLTCDDIVNLQPTHLFAGFPCQDISSIGLRQGVTSDTRSGLLLIILQLAQAAKIPWLFLENVGAVRRNKTIWEQVMCALHDSGYDVAWTMVSARDVGAPHCRDRWFALCRRRPMAPDGAITQYTPSPAYAEGMMIDGVCTSKTWCHPRPRQTTTRVQLMAPEGRCNSAFKGLTEQQQSVTCWATPRTSGGCARTLTPRGCRDLGTQLRFASTTSTDQAAMGDSGIVVDVGYLEWLMGMPPGWTHPLRSLECDSLKNWKGCNSVLHWLSEPEKRVGPGRLMHRAARRHRALGNACVPFCGEKAWEVLSSAWISIDESSQQKSEEGLSSNSPVTTPSELQMSQEEELSPEKPPQNQHSHKKHHEPFVL